MPLSWFRIPRDTSDKLKRCRGNDKSDATFERCVNEIVASHRGRVAAFRHVGQGKFSQARIEWQNDREKEAIVADLEATEIPDDEAERGGDDSAAGTSG
jgi:hypothetical protein